jgi:hypothetical protein
MRSYVHTFLLALIFNIILWFHPLLLVLSPFTLVNSTRSFLHLNAGLNFKVESTLVLCECMVVAVVAFLATLLSLVAVLIMMAATVVRVIPPTSPRIIWK